VSETNFGSMIGGWLHVGMNVPDPLDWIWCMVVLLAHVVVLPWSEPMPQWPRWLVTPSIIHVL
jgi:hypothetical protein